MFVGRGEYMKVNLKIEDRILKDIDIEDFICEEIAGDLVRIGCKDLFIDKPLFFNGEKIIAKNIETIIKETFYGNIERISPNICYQIEVHKDEDKIITLTLIEE